MTICVYIVAVFLIVTKLLDVLSTLKRIDRAGHESNPFAQKVMRLVGIPKAVWGIFVLAMAIIIISAIASLKGGLLMQSLFVVAGIAISLVQLSVARHNWTGKGNWATKCALALHKSLFCIKGGKYDA